MTNESPRREPQSADPYTEPPNSTVDDWHGQEVERDFEAADEALAETGGDMAAAERRFDEIRPDHPSEQFKVDEADRSGSDEHATGERQARENAEVDPPA